MPAEPGIPWSVSPIQVLSSPLLNFSVQMGTGVSNMPALFWLSSYIASLCLALVPQSGANNRFYCTVYYITLSSNCEARGVSKTLKKDRR